MKKDPRKTVLGAVVLAAVLGLGAWRWLAPLTATKYCDLSSQVCTVTLKIPDSLKTGEIRHREIRDQIIEVELIPRRPTPGQELHLIFTSTGGLSRELATALTVSFSMPGMDMGNHVLELEVTDHGTLEGRMTLPYCPLGQSLWQASIRLDQQSMAVVVFHMDKAP